MKNSTTFVSARELLTTQDVAAVLKVSERTAWALISSGQLRQVKIGRLVRVRPADLEAFLEGNARGGHAA